MKLRFVQCVCAFVLLITVFPKDVQAQSCGGNTQCCTSVGVIRYCHDSDTPCYSDIDCWTLDLGLCGQDFGDIEEYCDGTSYGTCLYEEFTNSCYTVCPSGYELEGPQNTCGGSTGGTVTCAPTAPNACVDPDLAANPNSIRVTWYNPNVPDGGSCNNCDSGGNPLLPGDPNCTIMNQVYANEINVETAISAIANVGGNYCSEGSTLVFEGTLTTTSNGGYYGFQYVTTRAGLSGVDDRFVVYMDLLDGQGFQPVLSSTGEVATRFPQQDGADRDEGFTNYPRVSGCTNEADFYRWGEICYDNCPPGQEVGDTYCGMYTANGNVYKYKFGETVFPLSASTSYPFRVEYSGDGSFGKLRWYEPGTNTCRFLPSPYNISCNVNEDCGNVDNSCSAQYNQFGFTGYECSFTHVDCCCDSECNSSCDWKCHPGTYTSDCAGTINDFQDIPPTALSPTGAADCSCSNEPTCSVTVSENNVLAGDPITAVSATGNARDTVTRQVRLWAETSTGEELAVGEEIRIGGVVVNEPTTANGYTYYFLAECDSDPLIADGDCTAVANDVTLPVGNFIFHCDVPDAPTQCTGNPFCDVNGGATVCSTSWQSCSDTDFTAFCSDEVTWNPLTCDPTYPVTRTGTHFCPVAASSDSCRGTISGTVTDASGTDGTCDTGVAPPAGGSITMNRTGGSASTSINADGTYSFTSVPAAEAPTGTTYTFDISSPDVFGLTGYSYLCGPTSVTIAGGQTRTGMNFTIALVSEAWFQIMGGNMRAGAGSQTTGNGDITQAVPATQAMLVRDEGNHEGSTGYPVIGEASNTVTTAPGLASSGDSHDDARGEATRRGPKEGFTFFLQRYSMPAVPQSDFDENSGQIALTLDMFDGSFANSNRNAYYASGSNDAVTTVVINDALTIPADRSIVVFVHGNLEINNQITVVPGGFLAFLVSGNIDIDETVVAAVSPTLIPTVDDAVVQGVFVADGQITIQSVGDPTSDGQFIGAGNFVAWNGFSLNRSYRNMDNNDYPIELFFSRPDIVLNTPEEFMRPMYDWYEISP